MRPGRTTQQLAEKTETEIEVHDPVPLTGVARAALEKIGHILKEVDSGAIDEAEGVRKIEEI